MGQILPTAPTDLEKYSYLNTGRRQLYAFGLISSLMLILGMWLFVFADPNLIWFGLFAFVISVYLLVSYFVGVTGKEFDYLSHILRVSGSSRSAASSIDVFLPSCGEDLDIIENTYRHVSALSWVEGMVVVYVLDDSGRDEVEKLAKKYGFTYLSRANRGWMKKAGNLRYGFERSASDFIVVFDADFAPRSDFLLELMPYFDDDDVAIVQSPQFFEIQSGQTWVEKGAAYIQELFYRLIQVNRDTFGGAICVGTNAIYRRAALEPFGGTALIDFSEDVHTGFNVISIGYRVKYVPINLAKGVCPDRMSAFFIQQYRWAMGSITLMSNPFFWKTRLGLMQRLSYLSGMMYYVATGLGIFITPLPSIVLSWFGPEHIVWYSIVFSLPSFLFGMVYVAFWTKAPFGLYALKARLVSYYAHFFALLDKVMSTKAEWVPTGAVKRVKRFESYRKLSFYWVSISSFWVVAGCFYHMNYYAWYHFMPTLFFVSLNYWLSMSALRDQV